VEDLGGGAEQALVKSAFKESVKKVLGEDGSRALEFHMKRVLKKDPYDILCEDPRRFYEGLRPFFGNNATAFLKIVVATLMKDHGVSNLDAETVVRLMVEGSGREFFILIYRSKKRGEE